MLCQNTALESLEFNEDCDQRTACEAISGMISAVSNQGLNTLFWFLTQFPNLLDMQSLDFIRNGIVGGRREKLSLVQQVQNVIFLQKQKQKNNACPACPSKRRLLLFPPFVFLLLYLWYLQLVKNHWDETQKIRKGNKKHSMLRVKNYSYIGIFIICIYLLKRKILSTLSPMVYDIIDITVLSKVKSTTLTSNNIIFVHPCLCTITYSSQEVETTLQWMNVQKKYGKCLQGNLFSLNQEGKSDLCYNINEV